MGNTKWIHLLFASGGLLFGYLCVHLVEWVWGYFAKPKDYFVIPIGGVIAAVTTFLVWRDQNTFNKAGEIINELLKVTWPTRKETQAATIVVIVFVIVCSLILGLFDMIWSWATSKIYS